MTYRMLLRAPGRAGVFKWGEGYTRCRPAESCDPPSPSRRRLGLASRGFALLPMALSVFGRPNVLSLSRHVPSLSGGATRSVAPSEARKRRASERHVVGCCEELARRHSPLELLESFNICEI